MNLKGATVVLVVFFCVSHGPAVPTQDVDLERLLAEAERVQHRDLASWQRYSFQREVVRRSLNAGRRETRREVLRFFIRPRTDGPGFDEQLLLVDGKPPSRRLREEHREAARFTKRYMEALEQAEGFDQDSDPLVHLWDADGYDYTGRETVDGAPCHRVEIRPSTLPAKGGIRTRLAAANVGTLWLAVDDLRIVRSETRLARKVRLPIGLGTLSRFDVRLRTIELPDGAHLPAEIEVDSHVSVLGVTIRKNNQYRYSRFVQ